MLHQIQRPVSLGERLAKSSQQIAPMIGEQLQGRMASKQENEALERLTGQDVSGLSPEMKKTFLEKMMSGQKGMSKEQLKEKEHAETKTRAQESFNRMAELLEKGNLGIGSKTKSSLFGGESAEDVGEFQSATGALEGMLVDMVSRGTLSNERFEYIVKNLLPSPHDRDATIKGKMKGIARVLGLDPSALGGGTQQFFTPEAGVKGERPDIKSFFKAKVS